MEMIDINDKNSLEELMNDIRGKKVIAIRSENNRNLMLKFKDVIVSFDINWEDNTYLVVRRQIIDSDDWIV